MTEAVLVARRRRRLHPADGPARRGGRAGVSGTAAAAAGLPPMAGRLVATAATSASCRASRSSTAPPTPSRSTASTAAVLVRARPERPADDRGADIHPTAAEVPRNLLRFYVWFSAPMSEGYAAGHVRLADDDGSAMAGALLPTEHELWDAARRRLTVLLDPARIKRGLIPHREAGYPLRSGEPFRLVVDGGFRDAQGLPLRAPARAALPGRRRRAPPRRSRRLGPARPAERHRRAAAGRLRPPAGSRPARTLPAGDRPRRPAGRWPARIGPEERSWR